MDDYIFNRDLLDPKNRKDGISAFMRIRNSAEFLEQAIESHIQYFDEIVAVYNQCTDRSPEILESLQKKYPQKLKIYHYIPRVYPLGSNEHKNTPADSVNSFVNQSNFALSKTSFKIATKLDADHIAIKPNLERAIKHIKNNGIKNILLCFSGINLLKNEQNEIGVYKNNPFAGTGDHWFFEVSKETYFIRDKQYELFYSPHLRRRYFGLLYFHCKFLQKEEAFNNYELKNNPDSLYNEDFKGFVESSQYQAFPEFVIQRKQKCDLSPSWNTKLGIIEKLPLNFLDILLKLGFLKKNIEISRAIKFRNDMENIDSLKNLGI